MSKTKAKASCDLCLADCDDDKAYYGMGFNILGPTECQEFVYMRSCRLCYLAVKLFAYKRLFCQHKSKLDQASQRLMEHSVEE